MPLNCRSFPFGCITVYTSTNKKSLSEMLCDDNLGEYSSEKIKIRLGVENVLCSSLFNLHVLSLFFLTVVPLVQACHRIPAVFCVQALRQRDEALLKEVQQLKLQIMELEKLAKGRGIAGFFNFRYGQSDTEKSS